MQKINLESWVKSAPYELLEFRQAIHTILLAIGSNNILSKEMVIKGGILLAIKYDSHRFTRDIDFSTSRNASEINQDKLRSNLERGLIDAVNQLNYGLDCKIQSFRIQPSHIDNPKYPELKITVGYAYKGTKKHKRLIDGKSPDIVKIDYSLNEPIPNLEEIEISNKVKITAYNLTDIIAEKFRAFLQQSNEERNRERRQDIYDLYILIRDNPDIDEIHKRKILESLLMKSKARNLVPDIESINNMEIINRAKHAYPSLSSEIEGELPDFDLIFDIVASFYKTLPWL